MARLWTTNDSMTFLIGTLGSLATGPNTIAVLVKPTVTHRGGLFDYKQGGSGGSRQQGCNFFDDNLFYSLNGSTLVINYAGFVGAWRLIVITWDGSGVPRVHVYNYATDTWSHADLPDAVTAGASGDYLRIGLFDAGQWLQAKIVGGGAWVGTALADAALDASTMPYSATGWTALSPSALWLFRDNADPVADVTGNGADEDTRTGTTTDADAPTGWSFDGVATGTITATLPALSADMGGRALAAGVLGTQLPGLSAGMAGTARTVGSLTATLPALTTAFRDADTGITPRPNTGITPRPFTGITPRP